MSESAPRALFRTTVEVRWRDLDAFNHVNNAQYLSYVEEARLRWFATLPGEWMSDTAAPVLAASSLNYRRSIEWPAKAEIELFVERVGSSSLTLAHRMRVAGDGDTVYCDGSTVLVWIERASGRSCPIPDVVRAACA